MSDGEAVVSGMDAGVFDIKGAARGPFAGADWTFRKGEQWVVMGPNGSGKSHLAALLAGEAPLCGIALTFAEGVEERVALVTFAQQQEQAAHSWLQARWHWQDDDEALRVRDFLSYEAVNEIHPFEVRGPERAARRAFAARARTVGCLFDAGTLSDRLLVQLSNGEMRRVLLARALLKGPALLVLDDPFAGLDADMRSRLQTALGHLAGEGLSLVLMLRYPDEIPACATHLLRLEGGRIAGQRPLTRRDREMPLARAGAWPRATSKGARRPHPVEAPVIALRDVTVRYGRRTVLERLAWTVHRGERWLVTGANGSGKTTLLSLVTGDNPAAYANDVRVFGRAREAGESLWPIRRRIGQVSPEIQCYFDGSLTALEAVFSGLYNDEGGQVRPSAAARRAARGWLREFGLEGRERTPFADLSSGEQRLVLLARALLPQPDLLLLDEPCLNLDVASRNRVLRVLERLLDARREETVVCVAHRPDDVPRGFRRVLQLPSGAVT